MRTEFPPLPAVWGDAVKLEQVFSNLLSNAVDAMPQGGGLRVSAAPLGAEAVEVRIADSGVGIGVRVLERIFEPFYTTKTGGHGSGLGLVVARRIVLDHEGSIEATSTPGSGTELRVVLPATSRRDV